MVGGGGWGGVCKVIFKSNPTVVLWLGWGFDNFFVLNTSAIRALWSCITFLENHRGSSGQILGKKRVLGGT